VVQALLERNREPLPPSHDFDGSGVYALYYHGAFEPYRRIVQSRPERPIYVGKAVPTGARKGERFQNPGSHQELHHRLTEHAKSLDQARNLQLADFTCGYLVVIPVWIQMAERFLIEHFRPVWNVAIDGFGNHDPGKGRVAMKRPRWDILHPGRPWAERLQAAESMENVIARLNKFIDGLPAS
jgi:hypothetical protein